MIRVFVFGTLMKNRSNHNCYLKGTRFLGPAILPGYALYDLGSFPGIVPEANERVKGEVYEIDNKTLSRLDRLEDNGVLYDRKPVNVLINSEEITVEVYVWKGKVLKRE